MKKDNKTEGTYGMKMKKYLWKVWDEWKKVCHTKATGNRKIYPKK
jgi:hypothetical protein